MFFFKFSAFLCLLSFLFLQNDDSVSVNSADEPTCAICLENFKHNEVIRPLPCRYLPPSLPPSSQLYLFLL